MRNSSFLSVIIKIKRDDLTKINELFSYKVNVVNQNKKYLCLHIKEEDIKKLTDLNIDFQVISFMGIKRLLQILVTHLSVLIGMILFFLIIYVNTLTIREITFSTYTNDNEKIKEIIQSYFDNVMGFEFYNGDINEINYLLRKEFSDFEWISAEKKGSNIHVTILEPTIINKQVQKVEGYGDLIAEKDGMIINYQVKHGIILIEQNQYVKQGQVLVSGNLRYNNNDESTFYIPAEGKVYAEVWYTEQIKIPKKITVTEYTGKIKTEKSISIFGLNIKYKECDNVYSDYDKEIVYDYLSIFSLELPIGIKKVHYLEKDDIISIYDEETAKVYAISKIRTNISKYFNEGDKILSIDLIELKENENDFIFTFFVRTYEDIALFKRRFVDE